MCYLAYLSVNLFVQITFRIRPHQCCDVTTELHLKLMIGPIHYL